MKPLTGGAVLIAFLGTVSVETGSSRAVFGEGEPNTVLVDLHLPEYLLERLPNRESVLQPPYFYSAREIKILGSFPQVQSVEEITGEWVGVLTGTRGPLEVRSATAREIRTKIPPELPTDTYELSFTMGATTCRTSVEVIGVSSAELLRIPKEVREPLLDPAVLYTSRLNCPRGDCYWESVLAAHPTDPNHLVISGAGNQTFVSHDGARTWSQATLVWPFGFRGDPMSLVTPDGTFLLSGMLWRRLPTRDEQITVGGLYQGPVTGSLFTATLFRDLMPSDPPDTTGTVDRPNLAYDPVTDTIYIRASSFGPHLFVSRDKGQTFSQQPLSQDTTFGNTLDTTPTGALRLVNWSHPEFLWFWRFNEEGTSSERVRGPSVPNSFFAISATAVARVAADSHRYWSVWQGPEIAIDKGSQSLHRGRTTVVWAQPSSTVTDPAFEIYGRYGVNFDVYLSYSDDDGRTWSTAVRLNDDDTSGDQVFPTLKLDAEGNAHITFLDRRRAPESAQYDMTYVVVKDGRVSRNVRVNDSPIPNPFGGRDPGDYLYTVVGYPDKAYVSYPCMTPRSPNVPTDACIAAIDVRQVLGSIAPPPRQGDLNGDGRLSLVDLRLMILGLMRRIPIDLGRADMNGDGGLSLADVRAFLLELVRL